MDTEDEPAGAPQELPVQPAAIRVSVVTELATFSSFVERLSVADAQKPSADRGWTNLDVIAHVQLTLVLYNQLLSASTRGLTGGTLGKAFGSVTKSLIPGAASAINSINSALPHALTGALAPEAVMGQFVGNARTLRERIEALEPGDYTKPIYYRGGPWPVSFFLAAMLNELAVHRWDIESRLIADAHLGSEARAMLPWFYWSGAAFMLRPPKGTVGTVGVSLADPPTELSWTLEPRVIRQTRGIDDAATATIHAESGTFVLALAGRISADDALRTTSMTVNGDDNLARAFLSSWRII
jgi:hypothetical protein